MSTSIGVNVVVESATTDAQGIIHLVTDTQFSGLPASKIAVLEALEAPLAKTIHDVVAKANVFTLLGDVMSDVAAVTQL